MALIKNIRVVPLHTFQVRRGLVAKRGEKITITVNEYEKLKHKVLALDEPKEKSKKASKQKGVFLCGVGAVENAQHLEQKLREEF